MRYDCHILLTVGQIQIYPFNFRRFIKALCVSKATLNSTKIKTAACILAKVFGVSYFTHNRVAQPNEAPCIPMAWLNIMRLFVRSYQRYATSFFYNKYEMIFNKILSREDCLKPIGNMFKSLL